MHLELEGGSTRSPLSIFFILILTLFVCLSCSDDDQAVCADEVTFFVNSAASNFSIDEGSDNEPRANFVLRQPSIINNDSLSRLLTIRARSNEEVLLLNFEINVPDENSCIPEGVYRGSFNDTSTGIAILEYSDEDDFYNQSANSSDVLIEITECDLERGVVSGSFSGTLVSSFNNTGLFRLQRALLAQSV